MGTPTSQSRNGHVVGVDDIRRSCFQLISIINGSKWLVEDIQAGQAELVELEDRPPDDSDGAGLMQLYVDFYQQEVSRLSLDIAVRVRILDEQLSASDSAERYKEHKIRVDDQSSYAIHYFERFSIREACNKIIHATDFSPLSDVGDGVVAVSPSGKEFDVDPLPHLTGELELAGERNGAEWSCILLIQQFVETVVDVLAFEP